MHTVLLVEGDSDRIAIETLAGRRSQTLTDVRILVLAGATNASKTLEEFGPHGLNVRLAGLCDAGEERFFRHGLERNGFGSPATREEMERIGFFVCVADLEDELIRALGVPGALKVLADENDLRAFRIFQNQPFHRGRTPADQLHRFVGTIAGRKARYAEAFVGALDLDRVPRPLARVLDFVAQAA